MTDVLVLEPTDSAGIQKALDMVGDEKKYIALELTQGIFDINRPLKMFSGTDISGPSTAVLRLMQNAPVTLFPGDPDGTRVPIFGQKASESSISDITFRGFTFDGMKEYQKVPWGKGYHDFCYLQDCNGFEMADMHLSNWQGDGARLRGSQSVSVHDNVFLYGGHDNVHCRNSTEVEGYSNVSVLRTNSAFRTINTDKVKIHDNYIVGSDNWWSGGPGIQIDHTEAIPVTDVEICNNTIRNSYGPGIWLDNYGSQSKDLSLCRDYNIHDNLLHGCGLNNTIDWTAGLLWSGVDNTRFHHNTIINCYRYGIAAHVGSSVWSTKPAGRGYILNASNNIVSGTVKGRFDNGVKNGYGIGNTIFSSHSINATDNIVFGNAGGNELNVKTSTDIFGKIELDSNYYPVDPDMKKYGRRVNSLRPI